ncbi:MAG: hypothetical protein B7X06_00400 [Verrucomicrobia bacterium 21-51-4]|nr:MAG: hypothetical protein B7X06_00400 [Verrucomicrobia bacterium 21-51-4]
MDFGAHLGAQETLDEALATMAFQLNHQARELETVIVTAREGERNVTLSTNLEDLLQACVYYLMAQQIYQITGNAYEADQAASAIRSLLERIRDVAEAPTVEILRTREGRFDADTAPGDMGEPRVAYDPNGSQPQ